MPATLPELPYTYDALEPYIDAQTMELHHTKHHQAYINKANAALEGTQWADAPLESVLVDLSQLPENIRTAVRNNGGGHVNHSLFWQVMGPGCGGEPSGDLAGAIVEAFGDFAAFKEKFSTTAATRFGSGWAWLSLDNGRLLVESTPNQDTPTMEGRTPILGIDVWEHAYYLKYQNRRPDYISAFFDVINWDQVAQNFSAAKS
jgi:Fe-Mn family superoxide dismutase